MIKTLQLQLNNTALTVAIIEHKHPKLTAEGLYKKCPNN